MGNTVPDADAYHGNEWADTVLLNADRELAFYNMPTKLRPGFVINTYKHIDRIKNQKVHDAVDLTFGMALVAAVVTGITVLHGMDYLNYKSEESRN